MSRTAETLSEVGCRTEYMRGRKRVEEIADVGVYAG